MVSAQSPFDGLKSFQQRSARHAFGRLFEAADSSRRFLVADETGLGKTHVAQGIIAATIERLEHDPSVKRIDIVYVCSNSDLADQNIGKLIRDPQFRARKSTRLTMLISQRDLLKSVGEKGEKPRTLVSFTPGTSFNLNRDGAASERAVLYLLLNEILNLPRVERRALRRIMKYPVRTEERFLDGYVKPLREKLEDPKTSELNWEPNIRASFEREFVGQGVEKRVRQLIRRCEGVEIRAELLRDCREFVSELRRLLARASVDALEPDLVILDEFQRFKDLLKTPDPDDPDIAAELAHLLFEQPQSRTLLLSATPYKIFTLQSEQASGDDHYQDLYDTLGFLLQSESEVSGIKELFKEFRARVLAGQDAQSERAALRASLLRVMCRTERRRETTDLVESIKDSLVPTRVPAANEIVGYANLRHLADHLDTSTSIEHWKASPYFANFFDRYQIGEAVKKQLQRSEKSRSAIAPKLKALHQFSSDDVAARREIPLDHPRLQKLAEQVLETDWWRLLWITPSRSRWRLEDPFLSASLQGVTKQLVFSSWVAAPTAIASLLSYEADRRVRNAAGHRMSGSTDGRLNYRMKGGTPNSLSTLSLFWPNPQLVREAKKSIGEISRIEPDIDEVVRAVAAALQRGLPPAGSGESRATTDDAYWRLALLHKTRANSPDLVSSAEKSEVLEALRGTDEEAEVDGGETAVRENLAAHVSAYLKALDNRRRGSVSSPDSAEILAKIAIGSPANIAYWVLEDLAGQNPKVSRKGIWLASAVVGSGFRSLFNRPESTLVLDAYDRTRRVEQPYWQTILDYSIAGGLLSVIEEHAFVLLGARGGEIRDDEDLMSIARAIRDSMVWRTAPVTAFSPQEPNERIRFNTRFALRYGNLDQDSEDLRLPQVRAAFNSPFWPFVLASTSVGQEGVDFHWWCHSLVHWNLPSNPVDYEQREGRIDRFRGHAIRKNIAHHFRDLPIRSNVNLWDVLLDEAESLPKGEYGDLFPSWEFPGPAKIERAVFALPLSKEVARWRRLQQLVALYRLAFGQPRQEDFVQLLTSRNIDLSYAESQQLTLEPPDLKT